MKVGDILASIGIVFIILMIIIPMPPFLVDIMLSLNISLSLLILLISMFNKEALDFSVFPSILLITTIFRIALNITTTRYILLYGNAGEVIAAFGNFVMGGNAVVGFIVFIIIVLVNFMVITKGSERVAEVAARFTLDAMPGKQMAIDADLNSGIIDEHESRIRRLKIQRESDFYGSMDGATKFVKGDSIAGIIITFINLIGGIIMGIVYLDISAGEALQKYALLSVGDGLVSSIPSLLISTATGIIVTRSASEENLGNDLRTQLFNNSTIMFILSGVLFALALTPLPTLPYISLSILFLFVGNMLRVRDKEEDTESEQNEEIQESLEDIRRPENVIPLLNVEAIELEFGYTIIPLADKSQGGDLFDRLVMIRRQFALQYGMIVPMIRLRDNIQLESNKYIIKINGVVVAEGAVLLDHYLVMSTDESDGDINGIDTVDPAFGVPAKWVDEKEKDRAEIYGYAVIDPPKIISTHLTEVIKKYAHELITRQDVKLLIDNLRETQPALVEEVTSLLSLGEIQKVLSNLLREYVSIRNLSLIMDCLANYGQITKDTDMLTEYVRQSMARIITSQFIPSKEVKVITLDPDIDDEILKSLQHTETGTYMVLDPSKSKILKKNISDEVQKAISIGETPIIVTSPIVRFYLKRFVEDISTDIVVLSYNEIDPLVKILPIGMVNM